MLKSVIIKFLSKNNQVFVQYVQGIVKIYNLNLIIRIFLFKSQYNKSSIILKNTKKQNLWSLFKIIFMLIRNNCQ